MALLDRLIKLVGGGLRMFARREERPLTEKEKGLARKVFAETLPYDSIYLTNTLGLEERQYTIPHPLRAGSYLLHMGPRIFPDATDSSVIDNHQRGDALFIHELTHVWQSVHRDHPLDYIGDSLLNQLRYRDAAYTLDPSKVGAAEWASFGAEQQAMIVENWYADGMSEADKAFVYIRDHIRQGKA